MVTLILSQLEIGSSHSSTLWFEWVCRFFSSGVYTLQQEEDTLNSSVLQEGSLYRALPLTKYKNTQLFKWWDFCKTERKFRIEAFFFCQQNTFSLFMFVLKSYMKKLSIYCPSRCQRTKREGKTKKMKISKKCQTFCQEVIFSSCKQERRESHPKWSKMDPITVCLSLEQREFSLYLHTSIHASLISAYCEWLMVNG